MLFVGDFGVYSGHQHSADVQSSVPEQGGGDVPQGESAVGKCGSGANYSTVGHEFMLVSQQYDPSRKRKSHQSVQKVIRKALK